jgi:transposase-like protein
MPEKFKRKKPKEQTSTALVFVDLHNPEKREPDIIGRPTRYTGLDAPEVVKILEAIKDDLTVDEIASHAGISPQTLYNWREKHPELEEAIQVAKQYLFIKAKKIVAKKINDGDEKMAVWILENRQRNIYSKRSEVAASKFEPLTPEEEDQIDSALKKAGLK